MQDSRILYVEAANGVSGDMLLGALLDLEVPVEILGRAWSALRIHNYQVEVSHVRRAGLKALRCRVQTDESRGPRTWKDYEKALRNSRLKPALRTDALRLCRRLFEVEAEFHGTSLNRMHLHEMGGTDLLIDVVGVLAGVDYLQPDVILSSPVNTGKGTIRFSHGAYPVPAPATARLLEGVPIFQNEVEGELTTPTGALLLTHFCKAHGPLPEMRLQAIGLGAGERDTVPHPNVVRLFWGKGAGQTGESVLLLQTNIDDCSPQLLGGFLEQAMAGGALDVDFAPIHMKKNRPAVRISILCQESLLEPLSEILFSQTTAIGLRYWKVNRRTLCRREKVVHVGKHSVRIKESYDEQGVRNYQPEYEDCKAASAKTGKPVKRIMAEAIAAYLSRK
jgi:uncharacterized protein (TIGR00299 family) protein